MKKVDLDLFLTDASIELRTLEQWIERRWIVPAGNPARPELSDADAARAILIRELRHDLGVNDEGIDVVLHLLDQMHGLRRLLHALRAEFDAPRGGPRDPGG